jgi:putative nucleotidyltransferase with HDIG domain
MSIDPNLEEQQLLAETRRRTHARMSDRERRVETAAAASFAAAVAVLCIAAPPHGLSIEPAAICTIVMALATIVRFETPFGYTVPTQLAFVPLLFAMPLALVPLATLLALVSARLPDVLRGELRPDRLLFMAGNAWYSIGPVAVFVIAGTQPRAAAGAILLVALAAQFVVDFSVHALRDTISRGAPLSAQLREMWVYGIDAALSGVGLVVAKDVHKAPAVALVLVPLLGILALFAHERRRRFEGLLELNSAYRGTAVVLGEVVAADDHYTGQHSKSVVGLALAVGERLELTAEQRRNLEFAALLHDVGKIAIPKQIINKPSGLDPDEWTIIRTHTLEGQKMLDHVGGFMREVGLIVRSHHERWDGRGYPDGLAGEEIPLESRIVSCCDTWNAMQTDRSYRGALSYEVALEELCAVAGSQLDPRIVEELLQTIGEPRVREIEGPLAGASASVPAARPIAKSSTA